MPVFEVILIQNPTKAESENGQIEKLIFGPTAVVARDDKSAGVQAVLTNRDQIQNNLDRIDVLVRPFA
jgi:hypothetical protein